MNEIKNITFRKKIMYIVISLIIAAVLLAIAVNAVVIFSTASRIYSLDNKPNEKADAILILGAGVRSNGTPSTMLSDRLLTALKIYDSGLSKKIIVSGDHSDDDYNEVKAMKKFLADRGVPSENIYMDHSGFSTYDSVYRAKTVFGVKSLIVVTQNYHMYRALYICKAMQIDAVGCKTSMLTTDSLFYKKQIAYSAREFAARIKDCFYCITKPYPKYMGDFIGLDVSGDLTDEL